MQKQKLQQTFNCGTVFIHEVQDSSDNGDMPTLQLKAPPLYKLRFDERVVGYGRRSIGLQAGMTVDRLFRCPRRDDVTTKCVAIHSGIQYDIKQVQFPPDITPPVMDLSLERVDPHAAYRV